MLTKLLASTAVVLALAAPAIAAETKTDASAATKADTNMNQAADKAGSAATDAGQAVGNAATATGNAVSGAANSAAGAADNATSAATSEPAAGEDDAENTEASAPPPPANAFLAQQEQNHFLASDTLIGMAVRSPNNEDIGEINDIVIDASGKLAGIVIGVGGFLGIGEKNVAMPMNMVKIQPDTEAAEGAGEQRADASGSASGSAAGTSAGASASGSAGTSAAANEDMDTRDLVAIVSLTKEQLEQAPAFKTLEEQRAEADSAAQRSGAGAGAGAGAGGMGAAGTPPASRNQ